MTFSSTNIMIVAGEASGDAHAAELINALKSAGSGKNFSFFGMTGPRMRQAGAETVVDADGLAIVGVPEVASALPRFLKAKRTLIRAAKERKPEIVILVDFPEFNLKLAKPLKRLGIKVVYFISPQLWAWRKYRIRTIAKSVDLLLSILPFEKEWYETRGVQHVEYIGNPTVRGTRPKLTRSDFCRAAGLRDQDPIVALLPGSRSTEISHHLPIMLAAASNMLKGDPKLQFVIALAPGRSEDEVDMAFNEAEIDDSSLKSTFYIVADQTFDVLAASDIAAVCSGTATLEAGIIGTPMVIVYRGSSVNYRLMMPLINVEHFGLINLVAGKRLMTELIQNDLTPDRLAAELMRILEPGENARLRCELKSATRQLGENGASENAANAILNLLEQAG